MKNLILGVSLLALVGCGTPKVEFDTTTQNAPIIQPDKPIPMNISDVSWYVLTPKTATDKFKVNPQLFCLSPEHFKIQANNLSEAIRYASQDDQIIQYYVKVTTPASGK